MELPGPSTHPKTQTHTQKFYQRAPRNRQPVQHAGHAGHIEHAAPPAPYKDLRELLNDKRQNNPPSDPKFNYLSDPLRDAAFPRGGRGHPRGYTRGSFRGRGTPRYHNNYKGPPHKYDPNYRHPREQHPPLDPVNISVTYNVEDGLRKCVASNVKLDKNWKKEQGNEAPKEFPKIRRPFSKNKIENKNEELSENNGPEEIKQEVEALPKSEEEIEASPENEEVEASPKNEEVEASPKNIEASPKNEEVEASPKNEPKNEEVEASPKNEEVEASPKNEQVVEASPKNEENDNTDKNKDIPKELSKEETKETN